MALHKLALIVVRRDVPGRSQSLSAAALTAAGCSHNRQSFRPIYTSPAAVAAPCTNCGGSSPTRRRPNRDATGGTVSSVPSLVDTPGSDLPAPASSTAPIPQGTDRVAARPWKNPPRSRLNDEPGLNETMSPAPASGQGGQQDTAAPPDAGEPRCRVRPGAPRTNLVPSPAAWNTDSQEDAVQTSATVPVRVRRASLTARLKPFLDEANSNELLYPNKADRPWRYIVLHHSASSSGNYDQIDGEHRKVLGIDGCGYHFVIGNGNGSRDGQIEVSQRWNNQKQGAHTRNARTHDADEYGIGICLVGDFDQQPPSARQLAAAQALIAYLGKRYNIASSNVRTHAHLAATKTVCPGKYFPSEAMLMMTKDAMSERPVRATWKVVRDTTQR